MTGVVFLAVQAGGESPLDYNASPGGPGRRTPLRRLRRAAVLLVYGAVFAYVVHCLYKAVEHVKSVFGI